MISGLEGWGEMSEILKLREEFQEFEIYLQKIMM